MTLKDIIGPSPWQLLRDYLQMLVGTVIYTIGYTVFLLPYKIVSGGVTGISTIIYYLTDFSAGNTYLIINLFLFNTHEDNYLIKVILLSKVVICIINICTKGNLIRN